MADETFVDIPGYGGRYRVSNLGRIQSLLTGRILYTSPNKRGHMRVSLYSGGRGTKKTLLVHRLVLLSFRGEPGSGEEALHRNGVPAHNALYNLHWGSKSQNSRDSVEHGNHPMSRKTHCKRGHPLSGSNLRIVNGAKGEQRCCRECQNIRAKMYRNGESVFG